MIWQIFACLPNLPPDFLLDHLCGAGCLEQCSMSPIGCPEVYNKLTASTRVWWPDHAVPWCRVVFLETLSSALFVESCECTLRWLIKLNTGVPPIQWVLS